MPGSNVIELLDDLIEEILAYKALDSGTKILYLERAISQKGKPFLESLDKLYQPELSYEAERTANLNFIQGLMYINDLSFGNPERGGKWIKNFRSVSSLALRQFLEQTIRTRRVNYGEEEIRTGKEARISAESRITRNLGWRKTLNLPVEQLESKPMPTYASWRVRLFPQNVAEATPVPVPEELVFDWEADMESPRESLPALEHVSDSDTNGEPRRRSPQSA